MKRWLLLFLLVLHSAAWAHKPSDSYLTLRTTEGSNNITMRWDIALRDLDYVLQLDRDGNGDLSWARCANALTTSPAWPPAAWH